MYTRIICVLLMLALSSCSYLHIRRPVIQHGNVITPEDTSKLHEGMTAPEVVSVMGNPVLANILSPNRIDYVYTYEDGSTPRIEKKVICLFENNHLKSIQTQ